MADLLEYKCPSCGGALEFNSEIQKMKCPYCDSEYSMEDLAALDESLDAEQPDNMNWDTDAGSEWAEGECDGMRVYACQSCGGEIIGDEETAATSCPYCGNPIVVKGNFAGDLRPDLVIPFKLDKAAAKKALTAHVSSKKLVPKIFKDQNHIDEIKGIYVPFWLFDAKADAKIRYEGTKVNTWSDSNYRYTETSTYSIYRSGTVEFENIPTDGSTSMDDTLMESIEPYNMKDAVDFQTAYLAGYLADKYDQDAKSCVERANSRAKESTENAFRETVEGYSTVITKNSSVQLSDGKTKYALLPVWILNTSWNNKRYTFAMNGQTGKFVGDLPLDKGAYWRWLLTIAGISAPILFLILRYLFGM